MLTLETLSEQGAWLSVRERLWLIWRLVRSLFGRSSGEQTQASSVAVQRPFGLCRGEFVVPDDFDSPLPEEVLQLDELLGDRIPGLFPGAIWMRDDFDEPVGDRYSLMSVTSSPR